MPHIHTEPGQHDHTVSAYIVRYEAGIPYLLLHRHKKLKKLMQPGGHVELNETPWEAILHEIPEETGYAPSQLRVLQPPLPRATFQAPRTVILPVPLLHNSHAVRDPSVVDHYHDDIVYVFVTDEMPKLALGEGESSELSWMRAEQLAAWDDEDLITAVKQIAEHVFTQCLPTWQPVSIDAF